MKIPLKDASFSWISEILHVVSDFSLSPLFFYVKCHFDKFSQIVIDFVNGGREDNKGELYF